MPTAERWLEVLVAPMKLEEAETKIEKLFLAGSKMACWRAGEKRRIDRCQEHSSRQKFEIEAQKHHLREGKCERCSWSRSWKFERFPAIIF